RQFTYMMAQVYQYPELFIRPRWEVIAMAVSVALLAAVAGAARAVARAVRVPPAEAMRPEPPASYKPTLLERLGIGRWLPTVARMVLRHVGRQRGKTAFSVLAVALSVGIVVVGNFIEDAVDYVLELQYFRMQRFDISVSTVEPLSTDIRYALESIDGV